MRLDVWVGVLLVVVGLAVNRHGFKILWGLQDRFAAEERRIVEQYPADAEEYGTSEAAERLQKAAFDAYVTYHRAPVRPWMVAFMVAGAVMMGVGGSLLLNLAWGG